MDKICKKHGLTSHSPREGGSFRCKKCQVEATDKRRKKLKLMSVAYKGGKCSKCGYNACVSALDFHHLDPSEKDFGLSGKRQTASWAKVKLELDKCIILCANCHREEHFRLDNTPS